ncbi:MAG: ABC transporter permease [Chloroflexi bacterium]|nr:ABC transporter permease [Chloroflexota bacterium]
MSGGLQPGAASIAIREFAPRPWLARAPGETIRFARQKPLGFLGALVLLLTIFMAIFADQITPYDPLKPDGRARLQGPTIAHPMGTDNLGRDMLSRVIYGARASIQVGVLSLIAGTVLGSVVGMVSGYFGGMVDLIAQRVVDSIQAFPLLVLAMGVVALLGASMGTLIVALGIVLLPSTSRVVRGATLSVKANQYIEAARSIGASNMRILFVHILPNVTASIIILASIQLGATIIVEASLSFLGLGTPPPTPTWGGMLGGTGRQFMIQAPWLAFFPAMAISLAVLGINLFGDALRDVWDPRLRGSR